MIAVAAADYAPIVGTARRGSGVCYVVGCNAWGQAAMSYAASLVPGILGAQRRRGG